MPTPEQEKLLADLERYLNRATEGMTPLEIALSTAELFRDASNGEDWRVEMGDDGKYVIKKHAE